jgi:hypothetical protein
MSDTESIKERVQRLDREELARFRAWFIEYDAACWDAEFEFDVASGKLDRFAKAALKEHERGDTKPL